MPFVYEFALSGAPTEAATAKAWFDAGPAQAWARIAGLAALDVYRPAEGTEDPYNKDDGPPLLIAVAAFASADGLAAAAPRLELSLAGLPLATRATFTPMQRKFYPVAGETTPGPLRAPFSYVVRYRPLGTSVQQAFVTGCELVRQRGEWRIVHSIGDASMPEWKPIPRSVDI